MDKKITLVAIDPLDLFFKAGWTEDQLIRSIDRWFRMDQSNTVFSYEDKMVDDSLDQHSSITDEQFEEWVKAKEQDCAFQQAKKSIF